MIHRRTSIHHRVWRTVAAVILLCTAGGCQSEESAAAVARLPELKPVIVRPVTRVAANRVIDVSGELTADKTAPLSFLVPGKVDTVLVDEGDHVQKGALLAALESRDYQNNLQIAEAALVRANDAYDRYEPLYRKGAFTEKSLIELKTGRAQAAAARDIARKALADTKLYAPMTGIIGRKAIEIGQMVSPQMPAFTLVKTDRVYARVSVPEAEIGQVSVGQGAHVTVPALAERTFSGQVAVIGAVADERTRSYTVKIELANPDYILRPGMIVRAGIVTDHTENLLTVPGSAIVRDMDGLTYLYVTDAIHRTALRRRVLPGAAFHNEIVIENGITVDDSVVVAGQHRLTDGAAITVVDDAGLLGKK